MIFLDKIYQRAEEISRSEEASELVLEVHVYMGANEDEQKAQIDQVSVTGGGAHVRGRGRSVL